MACSSSCPTQDHDTYGACLRSKRIQLENVEAHKYNSEIRSVVNDYRTARENGLHPETVSRKDISTAYREADSK